MSRHLLERDGVRIAYDRRGEGPPVALVGGLGMPGKLWIGLPGALARRGLTVVTIDNRGTGDSDAPLPPYRMRDLADDLAGVLAEVGGGPAIVVGISLGGMIAQHLALRRPEAVAGLVLAATSCGPPVGKPARIGFLPLMARSFLGDLDAARRLRLEIVHPRSLQRDPRIFEAWDRAVQGKPSPWRGLLGQLSAAALHSTGFSLSRIRCPVEVLAGDGDRIIPPENARILATRLPDATLTLLPEAGHAFPLEAPSAIPDAIERLRQRLDGWARG